MTGDDLMVGVSKLRDFEPLTYINYPYKYDRVVVVMYI